MFLRSGSKGELVRNVQKKLEKLGFTPGPIDGIFGNKTRKAVTKYQSSEGLEADGIVGALTLKALGIVADFPSPEKERTHFRALLMKNPNYFGTIKGYPIKAVKQIVGNTLYEELKCLGYNPQLDRLEAVVHVKREYGYLGDICSGGSPEYVRFFVDWNNDDNWIDMGVAQFTAYDIPGDKPLEYAVSISLTPPEKFCTIENLPKVKAILSWNDLPTPGDPNFNPIWGNVVETRIQVDTIDALPFLEVLKIAELELPKKLEPILDLSQTLPVAQPQKLSLQKLKTLYDGTDVPPHRFCFRFLKEALTKPYVTKGQTVPIFGELLELLEIEVGPLIDILLKTDGDTSYEELTCIGLNPNQDTLAGVIALKRPYGYSGGLCDSGSNEYVAFWEWDEIEGVWLYLGTALVNVHDIQSIPAEGLHYSVFLPVSLDKHRRPCQQGPRTVKIRAILSWEDPPPPDNPNWVPTWGNREETLIHVKPGPIVQQGVQIPYIDSVGNMAVCDIDQATGFASGHGTIANFTATESPFGGTITVTGFVTNVGTSTPPIKYKVFVRPIDPSLTVAENPWQPLSNRFTVAVTEQTGSNLPVQRNILQKIDDEGYYTYLEYIGPSAWCIVTGRVLAKWITGSSMLGLWEIKVEAKLEDGTIVPCGVMLCSDGSTRSNAVVLLDNKAPDPVTVTITDYQLVGDPTLHPAQACGKFKKGVIIHGKYTAVDQHFNYLSLSVSPSSPEGGATPNPKGPTNYPAIPTTGVVDHDWQLDTTDMDPCGYIVHLRVEDRTIVSSGSIGWERGASVGFCIEEPE